MLNWRWRRPLVAVPLVALTVSAAPRTCASLTQLFITNTTITSAEEVSAGPYKPSGSRSSFKLPDFCRVVAVSRPVTDSEIHFEIWLPAPAAWNGKFEGTGNGGFSSDKSYSIMAAALNRGYATAGSDTGHEGGDLQFGVGHPEKINDWAYRAVHVMTDSAKLIVRDYYLRQPQHSYFVGCSTGGHQALSEAQRYPADYDGIVAGDPGNNRIGLIVGFLWSWEAIHKDAATPLPVAKLPMITKAAIDVCDALDGLKDGIIDDPRRCKFDPDVLLCKNGGGSNCLTAPEVDSIRKIYSGAKNPRTGERLFAGWARGTEKLWDTYFVEPNEARRNEFWRLWVFNDPAWDWRTFDFDRDVVYADSKMGVVNANDVNLKPFKARNGKLVMYHGWSDADVPPEDGVRYYEAVQHAMGGPEKTTDFFRLFMVPGMAHCAGGPGPNTFDAVGALDQWVATGKAPEKIIASHLTNGATDRTRPLCPYPQVARWKGSGSSDDAANFACVVLKDR
ncbi:MAG TPA: tannase/feruloyl esterase family alpha/beta hydrolase [Bryobacteraceae bacterium]|nr:tannase/feruloyl esterase family alpha/beta hydrolase [Bryobacteraceae bacterium]